MPGSQDIAANFSSLMGCQHFKSKFPYSFMKKHPQFKGCFGSRIVLVLIYKSIPLAEERQGNIPAKCSFRLHFGFASTPDTDSGNFLRHVAYKKLESHLRHILYKR